MSQGTFYSRFGSFWVDCYNRAIAYNGSCPRDYHWPMQLNRGLHEIQVTLFIATLFLSLLRQCCWKSYLLNLDWDIVDFGK